jgi:O-6-methylguanine DNA methyltransferase
MEVVHWTELPSPVGTLHLAASKKGLLFLYMKTNEKRFKALIRKAFPKAELKNSKEFLAEALDDLKRYWRGDSKPPKTSYDLRGTPFQLSVWRALRKIPFGKTISYGKLAAKIGKAKAVRAVGGAVGKNPVSILIPCHRVIAADGSLCGYGGGLANKKKLLTHEGAKV